MIDFQRELCSAFCAGIQVHPVPSGYAVSTIFEDGDGDRLTFFVVEDEDGVHLEDDGDYLATLVARDIPFTDGARGKLLEAVLSEAQAFWDRDSYEIKTGSFRRADLAARSVLFLSGLIRVRDLGLLTRDRVRSAFRDDVLAAITEHLTNLVEVEENVAPRAEWADFPADIIVRNVETRQAASVYLVSGTDKLNEALLAWLEFGEKSTSNSVVALLENTDFANISRFKYQRANNRGLPIAMFAGDVRGAIGRVAKEIDVPLH